MLSIVYFGTPDISAELLKLINDDKDLPINLKLVVTQKDKPVGRKAKLQPSPVKILAQQRNIEVYDGHMSEVSSKLKYINVDVCLLFAFGSIIKPDLINIPKYGFWNVHPSLLPKYRGPSPINYPILLGDKQTGVTLIKMDNLIDHGKIISQSRAININNCSKKNLEKILINEAFSLFKEKIIELSLSKQDEFELNLIEQNHEQATFTRKLTRNDGFIPLQELKKSILDKNYRNYVPNLIQDYYLKNKLDLESKPSSEHIYNLYRALYGWPGIWTEIIVNSQKRRLKIIEMENNPNLIIKRVQLEGKNSVDFPTFNNYYKLI